MGKIVAEGEAALRLARSAGLPTEACRRSLSTLQTEHGRLVTLLAELEANGELEAADAEPALQTSLAELVISAESMLPGFRQLKRSASGQPRRR